MKKKMIITALCISAMTPMMAQNITGKVVDVKGEPLAFANVVLLNRQDSAFVKGAVSGNDGRFSIDSSCNGGIIKVTSVGYKTICKDCTGENVGIIKMKEDSKMLGEESTEKVLFFNDQNEKCLRFITFRSTNRLNKAMTGRKRRVKRLFLRY